MIRIFLCPFRRVLGIFVARRAAVPDVSGLVITVSARPLSESLSYPRNPIEPARDHSSGDTPE